MAKHRCRGLPTLSIRASHTTVRQAHLSSLGWCRLSLKRHFCVHFLTSHARCCPLCDVLPDAWTHARTDVAYSSTSATVMVTRATRARPLKDGTDVFAGRERIVEAPDVMSFGKGSGLMSVVTLEMTGYAAGTNTGAWSCLFCRSFFRWSRNRNI